MRMSKNAICGRSRSASASASRPLAAMPAIRSSGHARASRGLQLLREQRLVFGDDRGRGHLPAGIFYGDGRAARGACLLFQKAASP